MDRRDFLLGLAAGTVVVTACTSGDDDRESSSGDDDTNPAGVAEADMPQWDAPNGLFALGVASGDPLADAVVLWTRLSANPLDETAVDESDRDVAFDVAKDEGFTSLVASGIATATPALGHSVHIDVTGLDADTPYFYRFRSGGQTSAIGRTRTLPAVDSSPGEFRFVFATCSDFQWGHYAAWSRALEEPDVAAVVFLGDYIYETTLGDVSPSQSGERVWATPEPTDVDGYRRRYAQTRLDPQMQEAHAALPWIVTWDDHEVSNNYAADTDEMNVTSAETTARRMAGHQAFYESMPIRISPEPESFDDLSLFRSFDIGDLATMLVVETRGHADPPPCRDTSSAAFDQGPGCDEREDPSRTNLGTAQETWLIDSVAAATQTWTILANPLMFAGLNVGTADAPEYPLDTWDGYPAVRQRVVEAMESNAVSNPVVITGDWHAGFVLDVRNESGDVVAPEFIVTSITTVSFETNYAENNPQQRYFHGGHGYAVATVTPDRFSCDFVYVADVWDPESPVSERNTWYVDRDDPQARTS